MKDFKNRKLKTIFSASMLLITIILLSSPLQNITFRPGTYIELEKKESNPSPVAEYPWLIMANSKTNQSGLVDILMKTLFWVIIPIAFLIFFLSPGNKRRRLAIIIFTVGMIAAAPFLSYSITKDVEAKEIQPHLIISTPKPGVPELPPEIQPSPNITLITFVIAVPAIFGIFILIWYFWLKGKSDIETKNSIKNEAIQALENISTGEDLENVILKTYQQMSATLSRKYGINRKETMTPREFSKYLQTMEFPEQAIMQLTDLFEKVRYGQQELSKDDEKTAVHCLSEIVQAKEFQV